MKEESIIKKPYELSANVIASNIATYNQICNSNNPQDVIQAIKLAKNIHQQAVNLILEAEYRRDNLIKQLSQDMGE